MSFNQYNKNDPIQEAFMRMHPKTKSNLEEEIDYEKWEKSKMVKRAKTYGFDFYDAQNNGDGTVSVIVSDDGNGGERILSDIFGTTDIKHDGDSFWIVVGES